MGFGVCFRQKDQIISVYIVEKKECPYFMIQILAVFPELLQFIAFSQNFFQRKHRTKILYGLIPGFGLIRLNNVNKFAHVLID
jgi:hypothetical protein